MSGAGGLQQRRLRVFFDLKIPQLETACAVDLGDEILGKRRHRVVTGLMHEEADFFHSTFDPGFEFRDPTIDPGEIAWMKLVSEKPNHDFLGSQRRVKNVTPTRRIGDHGAEAQFGKKRERIG